jgi:hypothetical protein
MRQRKQLDGGLMKFTKYLQNDANGLFEGQQNHTAPQNTTTVGGLIKQQKKTTLTRLENWRG